MPKNKHTLRHTQKNQVGYTWSPEPNVSDTHKLTQTGFFFHPDNFATGMIVYNLAFAHDKHFLFESLTRVEWLKAFIHLRSGLFYL